MPTENRSSNTEQMVSVPLVERLTCLMQDLTFMKDRNTIREAIALLAQLAPFPGYPPVPEDRKLANAQHQGEPVAWQFFQDGKWWNGDDRIKDHRKNTEAAGYETRNLYPNPPTSNGFSAGDMADQGAKAFRDGQRSITELTDDLREILGRPNFACHHIAQALRQMGHTIAKKSEDEQASVIHWMLGHYLKYGPDWRQHASDELKVVSQAVE